MEKKQAGSGEIDHDARVERALKRAGLGAIDPAQRENDNRREARLELNSWGTCQIEGQARPLPIEIYDVSMRGVRFAIKVQVEVGAVLLLLYCLPGAAPRRVSVTARRVVSLAEDGFEVGASID